MTATTFVRMTAAATVLLAAGCSTADEEQPTAAPRAASPIDFNLPAAERYHRVATYPVYLNADDPAEETVAEISTVTPDGNTVIYTDAAAKRIGFLDIRDPAKPVGLGTLSLEELGHADDQPTSVAAVGRVKSIGEAALSAAVGCSWSAVEHPAARRTVTAAVIRTKVVAVTRHPLDLSAESSECGVNR